MNSLEVASLAVVPTSGLLVQEQATRGQVRLPAASKKEDERGAVTTRNTREETTQYRTNSGPAHIITESMAMEYRQQVSAWKTRIPPGAVFYDEMARLEVGLDQPGLILSVRV